MIGRSFFGGAPSGDVAPGAVFRQRGGASIVGSAEVIFIDTDARGIPHVHYRLTVEPRSGGGPAAQRSETRVLALSAFRESFARTF